jgi:hypothetical protein
VLIADGATAAINDEVERRWPDDLAEADDGLVTCQS